MAVFGRGCELRDICLRMDALEARNPKNSTLGAAPEQPRRRRTPANGHGRQICGMALPAPGAHVLPVKSAAAVSILGHRIAGDSTTSFCRNRDDCARGGD